MFAFFKDKRLSLRTTNAADRAGTKAPNIEALFFPKHGPPYLVKLPYATRSARFSRKPSARQAGKRAKPPCTPKPPPRRTFFEKLKHFLFT